MTTRILANALLLHRALRTRGSLSVGEAASLLAGGDDALVSESDRKRARRALVALQDAGEPILPTGEGRATRWEYAGSTDPIKLTVGDQIGLEMGARLVAFLRGTDAAQWLTDLRSRLRDQVDQHGAVRAGRFAERFRVFDEPARRFEGQRDVLDEVVTALLDDRLLELTLEGEQAHDFQPLGLVVYRRAVYVLGREVGYEGPCRRFAVDRIIAATRSRIRFERPTDFDLDAELAPWFGIRTGPAPSLVRMRFSKQVATYVRARRWHETAEVASLPDGGVELTMCCGGEELERFACEWGDTVEVLEPAWLRDRIRRALAVALAQYEQDEVTSSPIPDGASP